MSTAQGRGRGGVRNKPNGPLRKPGQPQIENDISQNDEKPPVNIVQKTEPSESTASKSSPAQLAQDIGTERTVENSKEKTESGNEHNVLVRAVNNPVFVPRSNAQTSAVKSSVLASAVNAPEFVPGKGFSKCEATADERLIPLENFVNTKLKQLTEDPGLLDELSMSMANYLSSYIRVENEMRKLSDILFQKCISEKNFQYTGSKLANYLDKCLVSNGTKELDFRTEFLKRCKIENDRFKDTCLADQEKACNVALFFGELLMNYTDKTGQSIQKFLMAVSNIIRQLLTYAHAPKLLICAGKLLKMTGSSLDPQDELFVTVLSLANNPHIDRTAHMLFMRVRELSATNWGRNEIPQTPTYTQANPHSSQGSSIYIPILSDKNFRHLTQRGMVAKYNRMQLEGTMWDLQNMDDRMLEEQAADLPVFGEDEWNDYATDHASQEENPDEALFVQSFYEQYGYMPYATTDDWSASDDYYEDYEKFLQGN